MAKIKGIRLELSGDFYVIPPMPLGALEQMHDRLDAYTGGADKQSVSTVIDCLYAALKRNYPEKTREDVADLVDVGNMQDVMMAVMDVSGMRRKQLEEDEAAAAGNLQPLLTGGNSTRDSLPALDILQT
jgi:hypothetical protein